MCLALPISNFVQFSLINKLHEMTLLLFLQNGYFISIIHTDTVLLDFDEAHW